MLGELLQEVLNLDGVGRHSIMREDKEMPCCHLDNVRHTYNTLQASQGVVRCDIFGKG